MGKLSGVERLLKKLDEVIIEHHLHDGDPLVPVNPSALLEAALVYYLDLPAPVHGISVHFSNGDAAVGFNTELSEPARSQDLRHARTHEAGHIIGKHKGQYRIWKAGLGLLSGELDAAIMEKNTTPFEHWLGDRQERECDIASAYILVRMDALRALDGMDRGYVAAQLDVPEEAVKLRGIIFHDYNK